MSRLVDRRQVSPGKQCFTLPICTQIISFPARCSYAMVRSLEELADLMNIPDAVVGVTVSAAGTSLPNYVASKVAAQQGFGVSYNRVPVAIAALKLFSHRNSQLS